MAQHLFKGKDRRMIQLGIKLINNIKERDIKARSTKRTSAISTRTQILDNPSGGSHPLSDAANALLAQFGALLED
jgi:hypothetical protein